MIIAKLTRMELGLIIDTLNDLKNDGCYWGNRAQFYKRRDTLIEKLETLAVQRRGQNDE